MNNRQLTKHNHEIVVIGGGVIGMNIAFELAKQGREVALIDPDELGMGASYGNAGIIADYAAMPVGTPKVLKNLPDLLFNAKSPLSIRYGTLPSLLPWLGQFIYNCLPGPTTANAAALGKLVDNSGDMWWSLAKELGAEKHFRQRGSLYLYDSEKSFESSTYDEKLRRDNGVDVEVLSPDEVLKLEPGLQPFKGGAHFFPKTTSIDDPGAVMKIFAQNLDDLGVCIHQTRAMSIDSTTPRAKVICENMEVSASKIILSAGAFSKPLAKSAGDNVPLDTERGYHVEFDLDELPITRPVCEASKGYYALPMAGRLRFAGTVELGGLTLPPKQERIKIIEDGAREMFPFLGKSSRSWFGFRPSVPSSVPIICPSKNNKDVIFAFGHGHIGLTLAPKTAEIVASLISSNR